VELELDGAEVGLLLSALSGDPFWGADKLPCRLAEMESRVRRKQRARLTTMLRRRSRSIIRRYREVRRWYVVHAVGATAEIDCTTEIDGSCPAGDPPLESGTLDDWQGDQTQ
jgi:hypothetical protein